MKQLTFSAFQGSIALSFSFTIGTKVKDENKIKSRISGSICNELFAWVEMQKLVGAEGLKLSEPIGLKFQIDGLQFDTSKIKKELQHRLLLRNNPAGRRNYARRFNAIFNYVTKDVKAITFEQLIADLDKAEKAVLKVAA